MRAKILWVTVLSFLFNILSLGSDVGNLPSTQAALNEWENIQGQTLSTTNGNVSNNSGASYSYRPSLVLDSYGNPCIAWDKSTSGITKIFYARWNGTNWVNASGATLTATNGSMSNNIQGVVAQDPSLVLDYYGNPCIAWSVWSPGIEEIYYARWNGTSWINSSGAVLTATNGNISNNGGRSSNPYLALDSSGNPNIAWRDTTPGNDEIYFARWDGTAWVNAAGIVLTTTNANMSNNGGFSSFPSLVLDSSGNPCISWNDYTPGNSKIYYARWNGTSWMNAGGADLTATNGNMSKGSGNTSLVLDSLSNPCIAWQDSWDIYYARWSGTGWENSSGMTLTATNGNVSNNSNYSGDPSLVLGSSGNPNIAYSDDTTGNKEIYFARWNGSNWENANGSVLTATNGNMSNNTGDSYGASLVLDSSGNPCIAWSDHTPGNSEIYFARWNGTPQNDIDKFIKTVDTDGDNDFDDKLSKVSIGDQIRYKLSITFTKPGVVGEIMDFVPEGTAYIGMEPGHKTPTCSYSDGKDWLFYSKNSEPDNNYAKRNGAVLKWKLNSDDGLSQDIIYKVKVTTNFNEDLATMSNFSLHGKTTTQSFTDLKVVKAYESIFNSQSTQASFYSNSLISPANSLDLEITDPIKDQWWTIGTGMNIRWNPPVASPQNCLTFSVKIDTDNDNTPDTEMLSKTYQTPIGEGYACVVIDRSTWENKKPLNKCNPGDSFEGLLTVTYWKWDKSSNSWLINGTKTVNIKITKYPVLNYAAWIDEPFSNYNDRNPLIFINGIQPAKAGGETRLWDSLLNFLKNTPNKTFRKFKPYIFSYDSGDTLWGDANPKGIEAVGKELLREIKRNYIDLEYAQNECGLYLIGHSMGGLVARSFMREPIQENKKNGPFCGDGVTRLITLATPHHGSKKWVNLLTHFSLSHFLGDMLEDDFENNYQSSQSGFLSVLNNPTINKELLYEDKIIAIGAKEDEVVSKESALFYDKSGSTQTNKAEYFDEVRGSFWKVVFTGLNFSNSAHLGICSDQDVMNKVKQFLHAPIVETKISASNRTVFLDVLGQGFGDRQGKTSFKIVPINSLTTAPIIGTLEWSNTKISATFQPLNAPNPIVYENRLMQINNSLQTNQYKIVINIEGNGVESSTSEDFPSANIVEVEPVKKDVELSVIPSKSVYCRGDTINMKLRVRNNSKLKIPNPQLFLLYPKELTLLSSRPQGSSTQNKWSINIGNLNGGSVFEAELKFKLKGGYSIPEQGINLSFTASFTSSDIDPVQDYTTLKYVSCAGTENISMTIIWAGFNTKTNIAKSGEEISAKVIPEGGSSPYEISFDWGDGQKDKASEIATEKYPVFKHIYGKVGDFVITITCLDQYGKQCVVARKITVK